MPTYYGLIDDIVVGDDRTVERTITEVPPGTTLARAWLTVKTAVGDADPGVLQKVITPVVGPAGVIADTGADGTAIVQFEMTAAETATLTPGYDYVYDVQVSTATGRVYTAETGVLTPVPGVTAATA